MMDDRANTYMSRIKHKLNSSSRKRKHGELMFLATLLVSLSLVTGYFVGTFFPYSSKPWNPTEKSSDAHARHSAMPRP